MFFRLGQFVSRRWWWVLLAWLGLLGLVWSVAPRWNDVTRDGDFAYLPRYRPTTLGHRIDGWIESCVRLVRPGSRFEFAREEMPSVLGAELLEDAFPDRLSKSQVVLILARDEAKLSDEDLAIGDQLARRFHFHHGRASLARAQRLAAGESVTGGPPKSHPGKTALAEDYRTQLEQALEAFNASLRSQVPSSRALLKRAQVYDLLRRVDEAAVDRAEAILRQDAQMDDEFLDITDDGQGSSIIPIVDVWTRETALVGKKLRSTDGRAQLVLLMLANEFMATDNIRVTELIYAEIDWARHKFSAQLESGLQIGVSGSAAVGGDMLRSAQDSIRHTELYTVVLVVAILLLVYRSPLLLAVPLLTIVVSLIVAMGIVATLADPRIALQEGMEWWGFKVFTTTRIFIVVILFGAGTDYCLFLIARYREELARTTDKNEALARALAGVGDALTASAMTTIFGLAMMFFADFGKFSNSGPAIGICLAVVLLASVTLAPALLRALGPAVFWPFTVKGAKANSDADSQAMPVSMSGRLWGQIAEVVVRRPGLVLTISLVAMLPFALRGTNVGVTYDFKSGLPADSPARQGTELLQQYYPVGESGPVTVIAMKQDGSFDSERGTDALKQLTQQLYLDGVRTVRSIADPMGGHLDPRNTKPKRRFSLRRSSDWQSLAIRSHRLTKQFFVTPVPKHQGDVARLELVLTSDPFSVEAAETLQKIEVQLRQESEKPGSFWYDANFYFSGTTAAIADLRAVTRADNLRIQILVVVAVLAVLIAILRRPVVCVYLIGSVLLSYFVTIGATELFFASLQGDAYQGLDWKVPLFLFVILVAIGEDYNIYLVSRVIEEQRTHGPFGGLRRAMMRTGGIITSCGVIMAGTFSSMANAPLASIAQLGFALSLGVLLDTLVVRTMLVPAFLSLVCRADQAKIPAIK